MTPNGGRRLDVDGGARLVEAWRAPGGLGLAYFLADAGSSADRRAALPAGTGIAELTDEEARELWEGGAPLTATEIRFEDSIGESWLAQATGPAWSEGGAAHAIGVLLVCLTDARGRIERAGLRLSDLAPADLAALVEASTGDDRSVEEPRA